MSEEAQNHEEPITRYGLQHDISVHAVIEALEKMNMDIRYNVRSKVGELYEEGVWEQLSDRLEGHILERLYSMFQLPDGNPFYVSTDRWSRLLNAIYRDNEVDPFDDYLNSLPDWDGVLRVDSILGRCFPNLANSELGRWVSKYLFIAAVWRTKVPGCKMDIMPIIQGAQGLGKSTYVQRILPPLAGLFKEAISLRSSDKALVEMMEGTAILEFSELVDLRRTTASRLKAFITRTDDGNVRRAYARNVEHSPRRCIFVGTTNSYTPLYNDPSGNRRFILVRVTKTIGFNNICSLLDEERSQLWAEALVRQAKGEEMALTPDLEKQQDASNNLARAGDFAMEDAIHETPWRDKLYTIQEIARKLKIFSSNDGLVIREDVAQRVSTALLNCGWIQTSNRWKAPDALIINKKKGEENG